MDYFPSRKLSHTLIHLFTYSSSQQPQQWKKVTDRPGDSPLSTLGHQQARETGAFLDKLLSSSNVAPNRITWMASPFLRTLQTSESALQRMTMVDADGTIEILPEYSIFEWDHLQNGWHENLPELEERFHYFPRVKRGYQTMFVPELPGECTDSVLCRCVVCCSCFMCMRLCVQGFVWLIPTTQPWVSHTHTYAHTHDFIGFSPACTHPHTHTHTQ